MSTQELNRPAPAAPAAKGRFGRLALAAGGAAVGNLIALWVGTLAGATWETSAPEPINAIVVIAATLVPMLVGGAIALAIIKRKPGFQPWAAWGGLVFALISLPMPFLAATDTTTGAGLAAMHVITGLAWFFALKPSKAS